MTFENWRRSRLRRTFNLIDSILGLTIEEGHSGQPAYACTRLALSHLSEGAINRHFYLKSKYSFDLCPPGIYIYYLDVGMIFMGIVSGELF